MVKDSEKAVVNDVGGHHFFYGYIIVAAVFPLLMIALMPQSTYGVFLIH